MNNLDKDTWIINTLKMNGVAAVNEADSGHPGIVLGAATMMHTLFAKHLNFDPLNPQWINRDRFILSAGHGSALLYAQLRLLGMLKEKDLRNFRQAGSLTPGHPEYKHTLGVEATTGPLGQGLAMAVGVAVAQAHLEVKFNEINHYTYTIVGDGDLQEGISYEAMAFAGTQKLAKLIILHDSNSIQLDTPVNKVSSENIKLRVEAAGFYYQIVENNVSEIDAAIINAKSQTEKPSFIEIKTIIGDGASKAGTTSVHGAPLGEDITSVAKAINWFESDYFAIPENVEREYQEIRKQKNQIFKSWKSSVKLNDYLKTKVKFDVNLVIKADQATRNSCGQILNHLSKINPSLIGGSADLSVSTKVGGVDGNFSPENRAGRNILFGVREMAMAAIANGIALHSNFKPFISTFLVFSDYLKGAMRLSSLMKLSVLYIFSHDSVFVGEDGPTHQPIEQLASIRSIPNMTLFRPADEKELWGSFKWFIENEMPTTIITTRQNIKTLEKTDIDNVAKGAYSLLNSNSKWSILASGSEVANALEIGKELKMNVYSVPSTNLIKRVTWEHDKTFSIEAASTFGWGEFAAHNFGINSFGVSAPGQKAYEILKMDLDTLKMKIVKIIKKNEVF